MAAPNYTTDLTTIATGDLNADAGTWDESSDAGWDTGGSMVDDQNLYYNNTECVSASLTKNASGSGSSGPCTIIYEHTSAFTIPTDGAVLIHHLWAAPPALNTLNNATSAGINILAGSSLGDFYAWRASGSDFAPSPKGGWTNYAINPVIGSPDHTVGTVTTYSTIGIGVSAVAQARGNPNAVNAIRYGRCESRFTDGDIGNGYATFTGFGIEDAISTNKWSLIDPVEGGYKFQGLMSLGLTSASVDFRDSNANIVIANTINVTSAFNAIEIHHADSNIEWTAIGITALGTVSKGTFEMIDNATLLKTACTFTDMDIFIYQSNSTLVNSVFRRCGLITQGGATITGCTIDNATGTTGILVDSLNDITGTTFNSDGTGHAIDLGNFSADDTLNWDNTDNGYAATDGSTGNETILIDVDDTFTVTINVGDGYPTPTINNIGAGTVNVVAGLVTIAFSGLVDDTEVGIYKVSDSSELYHLEDTLSDNASYSYALADAGTSVYIMIHNIIYEHIKITIDLSSSNQTIPVSQVLDRWYKNLENLVVITLLTADLTEFDLKAPTLEFTGTDGDSDDVRYNLEISTQSDFLSGTIVDAVSGTDAGFANVDNGGDTDLFNQGDKCDYDLQEDLINGTTYYYRVRGIDPNGGNTYGSWSETRLFLIALDLVIVVLNTADSTEFSTATPTLEFTGTDTQADDIRYNIAISDSDTFVSESYGPTDGLDETHHSDTFYGMGAYIGMGQTFLSKGGTLADAKFYIRPNGSPTGNAVVNIRSITGTSGTDGINDTILATSDNFDVSTLSTGYQWAQFNFTGIEAIELPAGNHYAVILEYDDVADDIEVATDDTEGHSGNRIYYLSSWTASSATSVLFSVNVVGGPVEVDNFVFSGDGTASMYTGVNYIQGQSFAPDTSGTLDKVRFVLKKNGSPTGSMYAKLWSHTGTYGTTSEGDTLLATSDAFDVSTLPTTDISVLFQFSGGEKVFLDNTTKYVITVEYNGGNSSNYALIRAETVDYTHGGNYTYSNGAAWAANAAVDVLFSVYIEGGSALSKISGTDDGFANVDTPANTDPFNSGDKCDYDIQAGDALANGTYYWRVRGIDPGGDNEYGLWSETRTFTINV